MLLLQILILKKAGKLREAGYLKRELTQRQMTPLLFMKRIRSN
jgi:hypothetical protein